MKYFHLTPDRQTCGPYSAEELRALRASGAIDDDTLAAAAGDSNWRPYRELHLGAEGEAAPLPVAPRPLGNCPFCGQEIVGTETPAECPHCGKSLHPGTDSLWLNFLSCMRRYACFRGRAGRTEFWSFYLFYLIFTTLAEQAWKIITMYLYNTPADLQEQVQAAGGLNDVITLLAPYTEAIVFGVSGQMLIPALFLLPYMAVTVRRLHDTGRSAAVYLCYIGGLTLCGGGILWFAYMMYSAGWNENVFALMCRNNDGTMISLAALAAGFILLLVSGLYLLVCFFLPTKKGANKYGPSL